MSSSIDLATAAFKLQSNALPNVLTRLSLFECFTRLLVRTLSVTEAGRSACLLLNSNGWLARLVMLA